MSERRIRVFDTRIRVAALFRPPSFQFFLGLLRRNQLLRVSTLSWPLGWVLKKGTFSPAGSLSIFS